MDHSVAAPQSAEFAEDSGVSEHNKVHLRPYGGNTHHGMEAQPQMPSIEAQPQMPGMEAQPEVPGTEADGEWYHGQRTTIIHYYNPMALQTMIQWFGPL